MKSTLAERRKEAIKTYEIKTRTNITHLQEMATAMRTMGLVGGADKIQNIIITLEYNLQTLKIEASVN